MYIKKLNTSHKIIMNSRNIDSSKGVAIPVLIGVIALLTLVGGSINYFTHNREAGDTDSLNDSEKINDERIQKLEEKIRELESHELQATATISKTETPVAPVKQKMIVDQPVKLPTENPASQNKETKISVPPPAPVPSLSGQVLSTEALVESIKPGVVSVETRGGIGSGFLINEKKHVLTNAHVVKDAYKADIHFSDGTTVSGYVISRDETNDLAIVQVVAPSTAASLKFGSSDQSALKQGESVYAFGFPFGLQGDVSFKEGAISRRLTFNGKDFLEVSNTILPGNSGGPLVNNKGQVIGVNTMIVGKASADIGITGETIKLAIPSNNAQSIAKQLVLRAYQLTEKNIRDINEYEQFVGKIDQALVDYDAVLNEYEEFQKDPTMSTKYLDLYNNEMNDIRGRLIVLQRSLPQLNFTSSINDTVASFQRLIEDMQSILTGEAKLYINSRNASASDVTSRKADLDRRMQENQKKVDALSNFYKGMVAASKIQLPY